MPDQFDLTAWGIGLLKTLTERDKQCSVTGCTRPRSDRHKHCAMHAKRLSKTGSVGPVDSTRQRWPRPTLEGIRRLCVISEDGCWVWSGPVTKGGYGQWGKAGMVHRLSWVLAYGPIPEKEHIRHKCDNPPCANPEHLEPGTPKQNTADMIARGRKVTLRGSDLPGAKLVEADVVTIKSLYPQRTHREIAELYGVSRQTIGRILSGQRWSHV